MVKTSSKNLVVYFKRLFGLDNINWSWQMKNANSLLSKYNFNEVTFALNYFKDKGVHMTSLQFLNYKGNMREAMSMYMAERHTAGGEEDSGKRNWMRINQNNQTNNRTKSFEYLFTESD